MVSYSDRNFNSYLFSSWGISINRAKVRALGFIGSLFALGVFVYFMLIEFQVISSTAIYAILFSGFTPNALGPLPLHVQVGNFAGLGTYLLLGGAVLGFIGTFVGRD